MPVFQFCRRVLDTNIFIYIYLQAVAIKPQKVNKSGCHHVFYSGGEIPPKAILLQKLSRARNKELSVITDL